MHARAVPALVSQLARVIGSESAHRELKWMRDTLKQSHHEIKPSASTLEDMLSRRVAGEPLQYILGSQPFGPLNLAVRAPVLIPRPETEDWTIRLAESLAPSPSSPFRILDLCTGTGCIPLLLCHLWPQGAVHATGVDVSADAIRLANENAALCGTSPHGAEHAPPLPPQASAAAAAAGGGFEAHPRPRSRSNSRAKNTFTPILADIMHPAFIEQARLRPPGGYDVITSNPPYIPKAQYDALARSVREFEDVRALLGDPLLHPRPVPVLQAPHEHPHGHPGGSGLGFAAATIEREVPPADREKGLAFYHRIAALVRDHGLLRVGGTLALEVGAGQAADVAALVEHKARLRTVDIWKDPWGIERAIIARN